MRATLCLLGFLSGMTLPVMLAQAQSESVSKYWIFFTDKSAASGVASVVLTERARARRALRGQEHPSWDQPVTATYLEALAQYDIVPEVTSRWLNAISAYLTEKQKLIVQNFSFVRTLKPVQHFTPLFTAKPTLSSGPLALDFGASQAQLDLMNATSLVEQGINGTGVRIGFLDTAFRFDHPVFNHLHNEERLIATHDFVFDRADVSEGHGHGTAVASVAVGYQEGDLIGPAHGAEVLAAHTEWAATETRQEEDHLVAGLEWMEQMGADVVNISLGYTTFDPGEGDYTPNDLDGNTAVTTIAADRAASLGVVVVTSAGNSGCDHPNNCWYYIVTPADADSVITVGAVASDSTKAGFSSFGPTADGRTKPDVAAHGVGTRIALAGGGFGHSNGTSFAAPLVAGVVAQLLQLNPNLTPLQIREILRQTAHQAATPDQALGWGIINAEAAAALAVNITEPPIPEEITLSTPYPNPARDRAYFTVQTTQSTSVRLTVYDLLGREVTVIHEGPLSTGHHVFQTDVSAWTSGLYFYKLTGTSTVLDGKMIVIRR